MQKLMYILSIILMSCGVNAQSTPKIKILLLGTFHFGQTSDKSKIEFDDLFSTKRQQELQQLTSQLARLKPDKVFVENEPDQQRHWDSLYTRYQKRTLDTTSLRNEVFQIAFRVAQKAGLPGIICVDHQQPLPYDKLQAFDQQTSKDSVALRKMEAYKLLSLSYPYPRKTKKLASSTLSDYLLYVNTAEYDASNRADFFVYAPAAGYDSTYTGVEFITSWYDRNAKIFTNILRNADPADKMYIVLFGSSHMLPLRHYFQMHPFFDVIELADVLK